MSRETRNIVLVPVAPFMIADILRTGRGLRCADGVPADATFEGVWFDITRGAYGMAHFMFSHPDFAPVRAGNDPPVLHARYEVIYAEDSVVKPGRREDVPDDRAANPLDA